MHLLRRLGLAQRIVIVVALGFALGAVGNFIVAGVEFGANFGWFGYAPLTNNSFVTLNSGIAPWQQLLIWLGLILGWAACSILILRPTPVAQRPASE
jgi:hypothetical protein